MTLSLNDIRRLCKITPNLREEVHTGIIRVDDKAIDLVYFPSRVINPSEILFIENDTEPLYRAGSVPGYGVYTKSRREALLVKIHLQKKDREVQKIICDYRIDYLLQNKK